MVISEMGSETKEDLIQNLVQEHALLAAKNAAAHVHMEGAFSGLALGPVVEGSRRSRICISVTFDKNRESKTLAFAVVP